MGDASGAKACCSAHPTTCDECCNDNPTRKRALVGWVKTSSGEFVTHHRFRHDISRVLQQLVGDASGAKACCSAHPTTCDECCNDHPTRKRALVGWVKTSSSEFVTHHRFRHDILRVLQQLVGDASGAKACCSAHPTTCDECCNDHPTRKRALVGWVKTSSGEFVTHHRFRHDISRVLQQLVGDASGAKACCSAHPTTIDPSTSNAI